MALDFPDNPAEGDTYTAADTTWTWRSPRWIGVTAAVGPAGPQGPQGPPGPVETDEGVYQQD